MVIWIDRFRPLVSLNYHHSRGSIIFLGKRERVGKEEEEKRKKEERDEMREKKTDGESKGQTPKNMPHALRNPPPHTHLQLVPPPMCPSPHLSNSKPVDG